jgi:hypothetical protein
MDKNLNLNKKVLSNEFDENEDNPAAGPVILIPSSLIDCFQSDFLFQLLNEVGFNNPKIELKYVATRDGTDNFHSICDGIPKTFMIIKAKETGCLFGGYTKNPWSSNGSYSTDETAFLFSLDKFRKFKIHRTCWATYNVSNVYSIVWGYPDDIKLYTGFTSNNKNTSILGETYNDPNDEADINILSGINNFTVEELELFQIIE